MTAITAATTTNRTVLSVQNLVIRSGSSVRAQWKNNPGGAGGILSHSMG